MDFAPLLSFLSKKKEAKKSALFRLGVSPTAVDDLGLRPKNPQTFSFFDKLKRCFKRRYLHGLHTTSFLSKKKEAKKSALFGLGVSPTAVDDLGLCPKNPHTFEKV